MKLPVNIYCCSLQTGCRKELEKITRLVCRSLCSSASSSNRVAVSYSNVAHQNSTIGKISDRKRYFTHDCVTNKIKHKQDNKYLSENITTSASVNTNKTVKTDYTNTSDVNGHNHKSITIKSSNNRTYLNNSDISFTKKSSDSSKTFTNTSKALNDGSNRTIRTENLNATRSTTATTTSSSSNSSSNSNASGGHDHSAKLKAEFNQLDEALAAGLDRTRLSSGDWQIHVAHADAVSNRHFTYDDPATGNRVMTRLCHFLRGRCCGNACRHCVYDHENVPESVRKRRLFNTSFWVDGEPLILKEYESTTCGWGALRQLHQAEEDGIEQDLLLFRH